MKAKFTISMVLENNSTSNIWKFNDQDKSISLILKDSDLENLHRKWINLSSYKIVVKITNIYKHIKFVIFHAMILTKLENSIKQLSSITEADLEGGIACLYRESVKRDWSWPPLRQSVGRHCITILSAFHVKMTVYLI